MSARKGPPCYVPTLTEVVPSAPLPEPALIDPAVTAALSAQTQALMVQRVLQRTDLMIERRLHEAIEQLILAHTQAFEQEFSLDADFLEGLPVHRS